MHDVFISHSRRHDGVIADAVVAALETSAIPCWIAPRNIEAGEDFPAAIIEAISTTRVLVLIFSSHSNGSDHIRREIATALSKKVMVVPFRIENVMPEGALEYHLQSMQWLDALTPSLNHHIQELVRRVKDILSAPMSPRTPTTDFRTPGRVTPSPAKRPAAAVPAALAMATGVHSDPPPIGASRLIRWASPRNVLVGLSCLVFLTLLATKRPTPNETVAVASFAVPSKGAAGRSLQVAVSAIRFFEGPSKPPISSARQYRVSFSAAQSRYIYTELSFSFDTPDQTIPFSTDCIIVASNGTTIAKFAMATTLATGTTKRISARAWGRDESGGWRAGAYRVTCTAGDLVIATERFTVGE